MRNHRFIAQDSAPSKRQDRVKISTPAKITSVYFLVGFLWIFCSDRLLSFLLNRHIDTITQLQTAKGWFYVVATAIMLYWLVNRETKANQQATQKLQRTLIALQETQAALEQSQERFRSFIDHSPAASWITNLEGHVEYVSQSYFRMFQVPPDFVGRNIFDVYPPDIAQAYLDNIQTVARTGQSLQAIEPGIRVDNSPGEFLVCKFPLPQPDGNSYVGGVAIDVTNHKLAEQALRRSEAQFRQAIVNAPYPLILHAEDGEVMQINRVWTELTGYELSDIPTIADWTEKAYGQRMQTVRDGIDRLYALNERVYEGEFTPRTKDGQQRIWDFSSAPIGCLPDGRRLVLSMATDITERKQAEESLRTALAEKEVLLKEIHHRVKNNLQIVSGLLQLQAQGFSDPQIVNALRESQNRIESMSLIHKKLYTSADLGQIDIADYVHSLAISLLTTYQISPSIITLKVEVEPVTLSLDQAIPCGLIMNELVSNALKYAFPNNRSGEINIKLYQIDDLLELIIQDNGIGLPEDLSWQNCQSLGLSLVYALATEQLDGSLKVARINGTQFTINFPQPVLKQ